MHASSLPHCEDTIVSYFCADLQTVNHYFADVERLAENLAKQLWLILHRMTITVRREPAIIVTVIRIIEREER